VLIIRHAEKPDSGKEFGVDQHGRPSDHGLVPRGWSRAGALAVRLSSAGGADDLLTRPSRVFAAIPTHDNRSHRCVDTARPIADRLGCQLGADYARGDEQKLVQKILESSQPALIVWDHGHIPELLRRFPLVNAKDVPEAWPEDRFDLIALLQPTDQGYHLSWQPQDVLAGDSPTAWPRD
jgi:broad specificity phosphatase PhoE